MSVSVKQFLADSAVVILTVALAVTVALGITERRIVSAKPAAVRHILIDPGHGGADGGAVGADGTQEKDLNLAISLSLRDMLAVWGYRVTLTRTDDSMISTSGTTLHERKVSDIHRRLELASSADLTVSIHQNKFPQTQYYGTQVFYAAGVPGSREAADAIRTAVISLLQPHNTRMLKAGTSSVYLLYHASRPTVLVECGFLSHEAEREQLKQPAYQRALALAITAGILQSEILT